MSRKAHPVVDMKIEYIPLRQLSVVWVQSQRPYNAKWARHITDNFDPEKFDPLIVTKPNGEGIYHLIEGQHRKGGLEGYAARINPLTAQDEKAPCRVVADADPARAAEIWLGINQGRKSIGQIYAFQVGVVAGREPEVSINEIVKLNEYHISPAKVQNGISAVVALKTVYQRHGEETLNNVLLTLRSIWGSDPTAVANIMIKGFGLFLHEFGAHVDYKRLVDKLSRKWTPYKLAEAAKSRRENTTDALDYEVSETIRREYNSGLVDAKKLRRKQTI